tara:strand:+ start:217 stop:1074 length:858 start_codon:yes stop_codon:yes gene_type:complete
MGMPNAYKVANEILRDRMKDKGMFDEFKELENSDIVVVKGTYDHIERVFNNIGVKFGYVDSVNFDNFNLNPDQIIFINCPGNLRPRGLRKLKSFVNEGGFLFTTDWALRTIIEKVFPGYIRYNNRPTKDEVVRVELLANDDKFLNSILSSDEEPLWWLEGSSYPIQIINKDKVNVLVKSKEIENKYGESPVFVSFDYGKGKIYHMISHFYLQKSETRNKRDSSFGSDYLYEKLNVDENKKEKYKRMFDEDTILSEVESAYSSSALMNKVLWDKKKNKEDYKNVTK